MKRIFLLLFWVLISLPGYQLRANHILGADIGWKYLSGDTFQVTVSVYRSCSGIALSNSPFQYFGDCSGYRNAVTVYGKMCCTKDITPAGAGCNPCSQPSCLNGFGIQLVLQSVKIVFPKGCCDWYVSWSQNSRDGAITTGAAGKPFYIEAEINPCLSKPDNSPVFNYYAQNLLCQGFCSTMDNGATDIDRNAKGQKDSLVYSLTSPLQGHNYVIPYLKGYSVKYPLVCHADTPCKPFYLDATSGIITYNIAKTDLSVLTMRVDELRPDGFGNYNKIGSVMRDIELFVHSCSSPDNHNPVISGINGGSGTSIKLCAEQQACFNIKAFDIDTQDTVRMTWDSAIAGAGFSVKKDGKKWPTGIFCWRPKKTDARTAPYTFTVYAQDSHQPVPGKAFRTFFILVTGDVKAIYKVKNIGCGLVEFSAFNDPSNIDTIVDYLWTGEGAPGYGPLFAHQQSFRYQYTRPGNYHFTLLVKGPNGCTISYTDSISIKYPYLFGRKDTVVCEGSPYATLSAASVSGGIPPYTVKWNTGETSFQKYAYITQDTVFTVDLKDASGCINTDTIRIRYQKKPVSKPATTLFKCANGNISLYSQLSSNITWTLVDGNSSYSNYSFDNPLIVWHTGTYIANAQNPVACPGTDTFIVKNRPSILVDPIDTDVCYQDSVILKHHFNTKNVQVTWIDQIHQWQVGTDSTYSFKATNTKNPYHFLVKATQTINGVTCTDSVEDIVRVHPLPTKIQMPVQAVCIYYPPIRLPNMSTNATCKWSYPRKPGAVVNDTLYPAVMGYTYNDSSLGYITYTLQSQGCILTDSLRFIISDQSMINAGKDTTLWIGCSTYSLNNSNVHINPSGGTWSVLPPASPKCIQYTKNEVIFNTSFIDTPGRYGVVYSYTAKPGSPVCDGSDTIYIKVIPKPKITTNALDTVCNGYFVLKANPYGGTWQFTDTSNLSALSYNVVDGSKLSPGLHKLRYILYDKNSNYYHICGDTAYKDIFVVRDPVNVTFTTEDGTLDYCSLHHVVRLVTNPPGLPAVFSGPGVYTRNDTAFFDPSQVSGSSPRRYFKLKSPCGIIYSTLMDLDRAPHASFISDTVMCGEDGVFKIKLLVRNVSEYKWESVVGGQDGGYFLNQDFHDSMITADYIPGTDQLKNNEFTISITCWNMGHTCDSVRVTFRAHIKNDVHPDFISVREGCDPFTVKFKQIAYDSASPVIGYLWDFGDTSSADNISTDPNPVHVYHTINNDSLSFYDVKLKVSSADGCSKSITKHGWIILHRSPHPLIKAIPTFSTLERPNIRFGLSDQSRNCDTTDSATNYEWFFGDRNNPDSGGHSILKQPVYSYLDTGFYTVTLKVTNAAGCVGIDSEFNLIDIRPAFAIFIPNAFLPGKTKDGKSYHNNIFKPVVSSCGYYELEIFNRWGELMFQTNDPGKGWDGVFKGSVVPEGVYIYHIRTTSIWGEPHEYRGSIMVMY
jgi:gliding motility-associated-like protein